MSSPADPPPVRRAEIVTVGTELLLGETVDTNGATLAAALAARGVDVYWSLRVGDNRARIREALEVGLARSDLVLTTGGLGPTDDDVTREAIAEVLGEAPVVDAALEADLRAFFARTGRTMPERNLKQAWTTPSVTPLANPHGTAPGWLARLERGGAAKVVAALPGPPRELEPMLHEQLLPRLALPAARLWTRTFKTGGVGESHVADLLGDLATGDNPSVATYARADGVHVRVAAKAADADAAAALGAPVAARVEAALGAAVWGADHATLAGVVIEGLAARGATVAVAERASAGALATALADADPDGVRFTGSMVGWRVTAEDVPTALPANRDGARAVAAAHEVRDAFGADTAIAVGDVRPVDGEGGGVQVDVAVCDAAGDHAESLRLPGRSGARRRDRVVLGALDLLRRRLRSSDT
jgi:nicotinamide-nucleotide amidase